MGGEISTLSVGTSFGGCAGLVQCQKDVKYQKVKHLDYGGGSLKKQIDTVRFTH